MVTASGSGDSALAPCAEYAPVSQHAMETECDSERPWLKLSPGNDSSPCSSEAYVGGVCSGRLATWQDCAIGNNIPTLIKDSLNQSKFEQNIVTLEELLGVLVNLFLPV